MLSRILLLLITAFWLTMNFLLWRSEFGGRNHIGSSVPVEMVWHKILTAPDSSSLEILHHGRKVGYCRWSPNVGQELTTGKLLTDELPPEGLAQGLNGYRIDFDGNIAVLDAPNRMRFDLALILTTNHDWQDFNLRLNLRPDIWEIHSAAAEQTIRLKTETDEGRFERTFRFAEFRNPQVLLREFELPVSLEVLRALGLPAYNQAGPAVSLGLAWEARNDWVAIGHASVRVYRLQARLFDRYRVVVMVSRVGEILRVELPDEWVFLNDQLINL